MESKSYLEYLNFDNNLKNGFVYKYLVNLRFVALIIITILITGIYSYINLPRRLNPEVKIPIVLITTVYPGANPEDIETLVTIPLEDELNGIDGLETLSSTTRENVSIITVEFASNINGEDAEKDVQSLIDKVNLPEDVNDPSVKLLDFEDRPIWRFALYTNSSEASLLKEADLLKNKIENLGFIDRVITTGLSEEEITISTNANEMSFYNLNPISLSGILQTYSKSYPGGNLEVNDTEIPFSVEQKTKTIQNIRDLEIHVGQSSSQGAGSSQQGSSGLQSEQSVVKLGQVANISYQYKPNVPEAYIKSQDGINRVVVFSVYKRVNADILDSSVEVKDFVGKELSETDTFKVLSIEDAAKDIQDEFDDLFGNFTSTIALVFITLFIFLGIRQATIVSFSIPLTFLISFTVMNFSGTSLNFLSMFSLLLSLGLLVDDAIVIVSAMTSYYRTDKFSPDEVGRLVWKDFIIPIWSTTITTVWAFLPLLLASGIIGEFIKSIPIVVSSTLLASTSVAVLITLPLMIFFLKPHIADRVRKLIKILLLIFVAVGAFNIVPNSALKAPTLIIILITAYIARIYIRTLPNKNIKFTIKKFFDKYSSGLVNPEGISNKYQKSIDKILKSSDARKKTIIAVIIFSIFSYALVPLGLVKNEFFPRTDADIFYADLRMPQGTDLETTKEAALKLLSSLSDNKDYDYISLELGTTISTDGNIGESASNRALVTFTLKPASERDNSSIELAEMVREELSNFRKGKITVVEASGGPPVGADVEIKLKGDNLQTLQQLADEVITEVEALDGTDNVQKSITEGATKIEFQPNINKLNEYNITSANIGLWIRTYLSGFELDTLRVDQDEIDITLRIDNKNLSASEISEINIPTQSGDVPLSELGTLKLVPNSTIIIRENQKRVLSITSTVKTGYNIPEVNTAVQESLNNNISFPEGYTWETGGANEENNESVASIIQAMLLSAILILLTMVIQLGSFRKALIILLVIPLAVSGVFIMFAVTGTPLSFPALIGVLALFGIVVNNSIVVVEKINQNLAIDMSLLDAVSDACKGRIEPIMFSSLTTIMGLLPITISDPLWRGLGGAIISGLIFSGAIMLFFIPTVYVAIYNSEFEDKSSETQSELGI